MGRLLGFGSGGCKSSALVGCTEDDILGPCRCECHVYEGVYHVVACCWPPYDDQGRGSKTPYDGPSLETQPG